MREIKFRAWDGVPMHSVADLSWRVKGLIFYGPGVGSGLVDGESIHLMQYTGLTDKNGVEIYEGDILNHKYFDEERKEQSAMVVMKHDEHNYDYGGKCIGFDINGYWGSDFEIIGNIYENPELMEESK